MISQDIRALAPEQDPLRMGMGWKVEDLSKPQIMIESTFGDSHPGSAGLFELVNEAAAAGQQGHRHGERQQKCKYLFHRKELLFSICLIRSVPLERP